MPYSKVLFRSLTNSTRKQAPKAVQIPTNAPMAKSFILAAIVFPTSFYTGIHLASNFGTYAELW